MSENVIDVISRVGFPIAMCLLVYLDLRKQVVALRESFDKFLMKVM